MQENRKKRIPGIHSYIAVINELRQELDKVSGSIGDLKEKISAIYKQEREDSPRNNLYKRLEELMGEIKGLKESRTRAFDTKTEVLNLYGDVKSDLNPEKGRKKPMTAAEIDARMKEINLKLIADRCNSSMEKAFEAEIEMLRRQKKDIGALEQKSKLVLEMRGKLDVLNAEIKELNQKISERQAVVDGIKAELKELSDQGRNKNPVVEGHEKNIAALKTRKADLSEKIKAQQEEIRKKEIENERFLEEISLARALEKQKDNLRQRIGSLEEQKNALFSEQAQLDPSKFDSIIFGIERLDVSRKISLPINLALHLNQHRIPIPVSADQLGSTVEQLRCQKKSFASKVAERQKEFETRISELDRKISEEKSVLSGMPPTDSRLQRFRHD